MVHIIRNNQDSDERSARIIEFCRANDIDAGEISNDQGIAVGGGEIRFHELLRDADGLLIIAGDVYAKQYRSVPIKAAPDQFDL